MCLEINIVSQCDRCSSYSYVLYNNYRLIWTLADTLKFVVHIIATLKFKTFFSPIILKSFDLKTRLRNNSLKRLNLLFFIFENSTNALK